MEKVCNQIKGLHLIMFVMLAFVLVSCEPEASDPDPKVESVTETEAFLKKSGSTHVKGHSASQNKIIAEIKRATARYHRIELAEADGYVRVSECVEVPGLGGMGYHYQNMDYLFDGLVDPSKPELLVYEPMKNGKLQLVAVEFMVIAEPWDAENDNAPMLGDKVFDDHRPEGSGGPPFPHYQLHAWVWKNNPNGIYTPFNPVVSCQFAE